MRPIAWGEYWIYKICRNEQCSLNNIHKWMNTQLHIYKGKHINGSRKICEEIHHGIELKAIAWSAVASVEYSNKDLFPSAGIQQVPRYWISIQFILKFIENSPQCSVDALKAPSTMMRNKCQCWEDRRPFTILWCWMLRRRIKEMCHKKKFILDLKNQIKQLIFLFEV